MKLTRILAGLVAIIMPQLSASADGSASVSQIPPTPRPSISKFGLLRSTKLGTRSVSDPPQEPTFMLDNAQPTFSVDPISYWTGTTKVPTTLNAYVGPATNGYTILMNGDASSDLKLSDLFVQVTNSSQQGSIGEYYGGGSSGTQNIPVAPTILWHTPEQTTSEMAFSLNFEIRNLKTYPAGNYSARLFFTILPQ